MPDQRRKRPRNKPPKASRRIINEDAGTARIIARSNAALAAGHDVELPADVAKAMLKGGKSVDLLRLARLRGHKKP